MKLWVVLLLLGLVLALWLTGITLTASKGSDGSSSSASLDAEQQFKLYACRLNALFPEPSPVGQESIALSPHCGSLPVLQVKGQCIVSVGEGSWRRRLMLTFRPSDPSQQRASIVLSRDEEQKTNPQQLEPAEPFPADFDGDGSIVTLECTSTDPSLPCAVEISAPAAEPRDVDCDAKYWSGS